MPDFWDELIAAAAGQVDTPAADSSGGIDAGGWNPADVSALFGGDTSGGIDAGGWNPADTPAQPDSWGAENTRGPTYMGESRQSAPTNLLGGLASRMGIKQAADGSLDYSDPKTIDALMKAILGGGSLLSSLMRSKTTPQNYKSAAQLKAELLGPTNNWTPTQQASADAFFNKPMVTGTNRARMYAADMPSPLVPGRGYAMGGSVQAMPTQAFPLPAQGARPPMPAMQPRHMPPGGRPLPMSQMPPQGGFFSPPQRGPMPAMPVQRPGFAHGGALGYVSARTGGQDDVVPINAAGGEYVWDADAVSALGDGNNAAGAAKLDAARQALRAHKRSAPADEIPPKAKPLQHYMKGT